MLSLLVPISRTPYGLIGFNWRSKSRERRLISVCGGSTHPTWFCRINSRSNERATTLRIRVHAKSLSGGFDGEDWRHAIQRVEGKWATNCLHALAWKVENVNLPVGVCTWWGLESCEMAGSCVRVDPPLVAFKDVDVGQVYKIQVTAANVGRTSKNIRLGKPTSKVTCTASKIIIFILLYIDSLQCLNRGLMCHNFTTSKVAPSFTY